MHAPRPASPRPHIPLAALAALLALTALLALAAPHPARASGLPLGLGWDGCGSLAVRDRSFLCVDDDQEDVLVGTFNYPFAHLMRVESRLELCFADGPTPDWWHAFTPDGCRAGAAVPDAWPAGGGCSNDWVQGVPWAATFEYPLYQYLGNNATFVTIAISVDPANARPIPAGIDVLAFRLRLLHSRSGGLGACAGCARPAAIVFQAVWLTAPDGTLIGFGGGPNSFVTWQSPTAACFPLPAKNRTWGEIKAIYR